MFYRINKRPIYAKFSALCDKSFSICCYLQFRVPRFGFQILTVCRSLLCHITVPGICVCVRPYTSPTVDFLRFYVYTIGRLA